MIGGDLRQQRGDVRPRQLCEQLVLGRVAGLPFGHVDAFGLQLRDVNVVAGDTVQMWFVKTGVMYEVITMKGDESWLVNILKTWQFE